MKNLVTGTALVAALAASGTLASAQTHALNATTDAALSVPTGDCAATRLAKPTASVRLGAGNLASDAIVGGPAACAAAVRTDNPNVSATLETRDNVSVVRILGQHEGFSKVNVIGKDGTPIGSIDVNVYPREHTTT